MKQIDITRKDLFPIGLITVSLALLIMGLTLKSLWIVAGVAGLITAWFLCVDTVLANQQMNLIKKVVFGFIILFLPLAFAYYISA